MIQRIKFPVSIRVITVTVVLLAAAFAQAAPQTADPPIASDRPGLSDPPSVLGPRVLHVEAGFTTQRDRSRDTVTRAISVPETTVRIGLGHRLELRLLDEGFTSETTTAAPSVRGIDDFTVGVKVKLFASESGFDSAFIPLFSLPTGSDSTTSDEVDPWFKFSWQQAFAAGFQLGGEVGLSASRGDRGRTWQQAIGLGLSHAIGLGWNGFGEFYDAGGDWTLDTGASRPVTRNMQMDLSIGRGLSEGAADWFVSAGLVVRHLPSR